MNTINESYGDFNAALEVFDVNSYIILKNALIAVGMPTQANTVKEGMSESKFNLLAQIAERLAKHQGRQEVLEMLHQWNIVPGSEGQGGPQS